MQPSLSVPQPAASRRLPVKRAQATLGISAAQERLYRVQRHLVAEQDPCSVTAVAERHIGLHAARLTSPWVAMRARVPTFEAAQLRGLLHDERSLIKLRCMRRTLHILPLDLAPIAHAATLDQRLGACRATLRRLGHSERSLAAMAARVCELLSSRELPYRTLEAELRPSRGYRTDLIRLAIKWLWERGDLVYLDRSPSLHHEHRSFALTAQAFPTLELAPEPVDSVQQDLIVAHVRAFGPVAASDIAWWSGIGRGRVAAALERLRSELVPVRVDELGDQLLIHADDVDALLAAGDLTPGHVSLLAWEDPSLKGYFTTRSRYVAPADYDQLFNQIGEARASITVDGRVVGIWSWDKRTNSINSRSLRRLTTDESARVNERLSDMQRFLRADLPDRGGYAASRNEIPGLCGSGQSRSTTAASSV